MAIKVVQADDDAYVRLLDGESGRLLREEGGRLAWASERLAWAGCACHGVAGASRSSLLSARPAAGPGTRRLARLVPAPRRSTSASAPPLFHHLRPAHAGELFAECPVPTDKPLVTAVEPVVDSSRYFVIQVRGAWLDFFSLKAD